MARDKNAQTKLIRLGQILRIFMKKEKVASSWLSKQFQTTPRTIQRDLLLLKEIHAAQSVSRAVDHVGLSQPAISVPDGQIYLQYQGSPMPVTSEIQTGSAMTNTASIAYLSQRSTRSARIFVYFRTKGILCRMSCTRPNGQSHPQTRRPTSAPAAARKPIT